MYILGISAYYHDSAACLVRDGEIISAAQEERFTRKKHDSDFPTSAINFCLNNSKISGKTEFVTIQEPDGKPPRKLDIESDDATLDSDGGRTDALAKVKEEMLQVEKNAHDQALSILTEAVAKIEALEELDDDTFTFERERSVMALRELASQIQKNRPLSELERLEHQLRRAIEKQEFERAARLRDRLRELRKAHIC